VDRAELELDGELVAFHLAVDVSDPRADETATRGEVLNVPVELRLGSVPVARSDHLVAEGEALADVVDELDVDVA